MPRGANGDGTLVFARAVDHVFWTKDIAGAAARIAGEAGDDPSLVRPELWASGSLSPRSRKELESLGWTVHDNAAAEIGRNR
jgi:hypothetical protein